MNTRRYKVKSVKYQSLNWNYWLTSIWCIFALEFNDFHWFFFFFFCLYILKEMLLITFMPKIQSYLEILLISFTYYLVGMYLFMVDKENTRTTCKICSQLTIKTNERCRWSRSGVFINYSVWTYCTYYSDFSNVEFQQVFVSSLLAFVWHLVKAILTILEKSIKLSLPGVHLH